LARREARELPDKLRAMANANITNADLVLVAKVHIQGLERGVFTFVARHACQKLPQVHYVVSLSFAQKDTFGAFICPSTPRKA